MSSTVISATNFIVRSKVAQKRITTACENSIPLNNSSYRFTNWPAKKIDILENSISLIQDDEISYTPISTDKTVRDNRGVSAVFFDQTPYTFSITLPEDTVNADIFSPIAAWCESADWDEDSHKLMVQINFGNDLGEFELCWEWETESGERLSASFSGEVFSTKLDIYDHFGVMMNEVKNRFDWITLDLLRQTRWGWSYDPSIDSSFQTWLLIFQEVRDGMEGRFQRLIKEHRRRLTSQSRSISAERIRKMSPRLEEKITENLQSRPNRRYTVEKQILNANTPENRYMKHILTHTLLKLQEVIDRIEPIERIADLFKERLKEWAESWAILKENRFWREIGSFTGLRKESLILSQDPLYAGVRRSWYLLQQGLQFLDQDLKGGIQNVAQLYEVWCLVKLDEIILQSKNEYAENWRRTNFEQFNFDKDDFDQEREELRSGAIKFEYEHTKYNDVTLSLLFQPTASDKLSSSKGIWDGMVAMPVVQKPDIVLRLHRNDLPKQPVFTWIFDAKYRLNKNAAPDDAINQMHRYRDAILWRSESLGTSSDIIRESIGAFVLYPGTEDEKTVNSKQIISISKTNIGAYPLKPSSEGSNTLLQAAVEKLIVVEREFDSVEEKGAEYFISVPTSKIKSTGIIGVGSLRETQRKVSFWNECRYYHLPVSESVKYNIHPENWEYLAPQRNRGDKKNHYGLFPILNIEKISRKEVQKRYEKRYKHSDIVNIKPNTDKESDLYWIFTLGEKIDAPEDLLTLKRGEVVGEV